MAGQDVDPITLSQDAQNNWRGLLEPNEELLWHGCPNPHFRLNTETAKPIGWGVCLFAMGLFLLWFEPQSRGNLAQVQWGWLLILIGLCVGIVPSIWRWRRRRATYYTLTNKRGFGSVFCYADTTADDDGPRYVNRGFEQIANARKVHDLMRRTFTQELDDDANKDKAR